MYEQREEGLLLFPLNTAGRHYGAQKLVGADESFDCTLTGHLVFVIKCIEAVNTSVKYGVYLLTWGFAPKLLIQQFHFGRSVYLMLFDAVQQVVQLIGISFLAQQGCLVEVLEVSFNLVMFVYEVNDTCIILLWGNTVQSA